MRFKKGTKVEVLTLNEGPSNSWRLAEIIGSNNHHYVVRYEGYMEEGFGEATVERVSRKVIRPCPPLVDVLHDWLPGDVVEVLHKSSWKMATIITGSKRDRVMVRFVGSGVEFEASRYFVRARLCWQDGEWIAVGKDSSKSEDDLRFRIPSSRNNDNNYDRKRITFVSGRTKCGDESTRTTDIALESQVMPSRTVKRKLFRVLPQAELHSRPAAKKMRLQNKYRLCNNPKKVEINLVSDDDVSVATSVGSCSSVLRNSSVKYEDYDSQSSDAESFCQLRTKEGNCVPPSDEIHRLELHAYRCTIKALYELGPLSWEQELLLTNLRDSLNISTDEHLSEIRNLVSLKIPAKSAAYMGFS